MLVALVPDLGTECGQGIDAGMEGVLRQVRIGDVTLLAEHPQDAVQTPASTVLDGVAESLARRGLADQGIVDLLAALLQSLHDTAGPVDGRSFFVACNQKGDGSAMVRMILDERLHRRDHGRERAFHVAGAAPEETAVADGRLEGGRVPLLGRAGRNHVRVAGEAEERAVLAASGPEVGDLPERHLLDPKSDRGQPLGHECLTARVVGCDGRAADQLARQIQGRGHRHQPSSLS